MIRIFTPLGRGSCEKGSRLESSFFGCQGKRTSQMRGARDKLHGGGQSEKPKEGTAENPQRPPAGPSVLRISWL